MNNEINSVNSNSNKFANELKGDYDLKNSSDSKKDKMEQLNGDQAENDQSSDDNGVCLSDNSSVDECSSNSDKINNQKLPYHEIKFRPPKYELPKRAKQLSLPDTVTILDGLKGSKVYLIGTAHFSEKSQQEVSEVIKQTQPNVVFLELCDSRLSILSLDEKTIIDESKTMGIAKIRRNIRDYGVIQGIMYMLLLSLSAHLTKELGMAPGGEFRRAFQEASKVPGCVVHLGDRPVHITLRRAISSLSVWQKIKLAFGIIFNNETISKEEVEKCKQRDLLEEMLAEMTGEFPALSKVFVYERDTYLAYSLWLSASPVPKFEAPAGYNPTIVVAVVGIGHVPGIVKQWGKVTEEDVKPLLTLPQPSYTFYLIRKTIRYSFIGLISWGAYKMLVPNPIHQVLSSASYSTFNWIQSSITNFNAKNN